jgi:hypothetical protein
MKVRCYPVYHERCFVNDLTYWIIADHVPGLSRTEN